MPKGLWDYPLTTLERILDYVDRPGQAVRGGLTGGLSGAWEGLTGQKKVYGTDILDRWGLDPGWKRSVAGFGVDVVTDPLTYIPAAWFGKAIKGVGAVGKGAATKFAPGLTEAAGRNLSQASKLFRTGAGLPDDYASMSRIARSNLQGINQNTADKVFKMLHGYSPAERQAALRALETGGATGRVAELTDKFAPEFSSLFDREAALFLQDAAKKRPAYAPYVFQADRQAARRGKTFGAKLGFAKKRLTPTIEEAIRSGAADDLAEAAFTRMAAGERSIRAGSHILDTAKKFGRFVDEADNLPPGIRRLVGGDMARNLGDARFMNQMVDLGGGVTAKLKDIALPENIVADLHDYFIRAGADMGTKWPDALHKAGTWASRVFREGATSLRPAFHMTNLQGNIYNSAIAAKNPLMFFPEAVRSLVGTAKQGRQLWRGGERKFKDIGRYSGDEIAKAIDDFNISNPMSTFAGSYSDDLLGDLKKALDKGGRRKLSPGRLFDSYRAGMRKLGTSIEGGSKEALFLNRLRKGDTLEKAAQIVNKHLFDYGDLTNFEKTYMRNLFPFYTWSRKNIPLQASTLATKPGMFGLVGKAKHAVEDVTDSEGILVPDAERPEWRREEMAIQLPGTKKGEARFLTPYLPFKDIGIGPMDIGSMLAPQYKIPVEYLANRNLLTMRPLYDPDLGYLGDIQERKSGLPFPAPAAAHHIFGNFNPLLPYISKGATSMASGDIGNILNTLGIRAPLTPRENLRRERRTQRTTNRKIQKISKRQQDDIERELRAVMLALGLR